ncbi:MAG: pyridoxal kinase PdxY [Rhodospirillales bacterium]|nr:pyridoxal kinase PdxY [Rhodospirillales bacterium]
MAILSINSHVARGHVGNSATVFPLQCLGYEVWPVHTTLFSNHPGHGQWRGHVVEPRRVAQVLDGIADGGAFAGVEAVLTGYLGSVDTGEAVLTAVAAVKAAARGGAKPALYCCDPVIGDAEEGLYVEDALARWFGERAVAAADIITPNRFELAYLSGRPAATEVEALAAARTLIERGPWLVVATSIAADGAAAAGAEGRISTLAVTAAGAWRVTTPKLTTRAKGAGDVLAALFLGRYLEAGDAGAALEQAVSSVFGLITAVGNTLGGEQARDLPMVASRVEITDPATRFLAEPLD